MILYIEVIQQLCGLNFAQLWPLTPLKWLKWTFYILPTFGSWDQLWSFHLPPTPLPTSFWTLSYWMTAYDSILLWCRKTKLAKGNLFWLRKGSLRIDLTAELHFTMGPFFSEIAFEVPFFWMKYWFVWTRKSIQARILTNQKTGFR